MHRIIDILLLNATAVSDFKKALRKKHNLRTALRTQNSQRNIRHFGINKVRNNTININLPLMIFIRMHSQESQFHNQCFFCLMKSIIYVQIPPFVNVFGKEIQTHEARASPGESSDEKFKKIYYNS